MTIIQTIKYLIDCTLEAIFPEPFPWRGKSEWEEIVRHLPYTEQLYFAGNVTEETIVHGGQDSDATEQRQLRNYVSKHLVRAAAYLWYEHDNLAQQLILRGKNNKVPTKLIFERLGQMAAEAIVETDWVEDIDLIIPVPLHGYRRWQRGFNQASIVAHAISQATGIPVDETHLYRQRNNPHQQGLKQSERINNSKGLFGIRNPKELKGKHILLVDDVITTGSTIRACIDALRDVRTFRVSAFALAKVR